MCSLSVMGRVVDVVRGSLDTPIIQILSEWVFVVAVTRGMHRRKFRYDGHIAILYGW